MASTRDSCLPPEITLTFDEVGQSNILCRLGDPGFNLLQIVHTSGDRLAKALIDSGTYSLPTVVLLPDQISLLPTFIFPFSSGFLPAVYSLIQSDPSSFSFHATVAASQQQTNIVTSALLLTLARRLQEGAPGLDILPGLEIPVRASTSLILMLYYLALALDPSPSTYNDVGVLVSSLPVVNVGGHQSATGHDIAKLYYEKGLQLDPAHPHLLSNFGSLLKDAGHIAQAIQIYDRVLQIQPDLDVALVNIANTLKDMGHPAEAIPYYYRAVITNHYLPEAICGLVYSMNAVCDWTGRGEPQRLASVDSSLKQISYDAPGQWMLKLIHICDQQLSAPSTRNFGLVRANKTLDDWVNLVEQACGRKLEAEERREWIGRLSLFYTDYDDRKPTFLNEGGFLIRFLEWWQTRMQRSWYIKAYGNVIQSNHLLTSSSHETSTPPSLLPFSVELPSLPSVLPFHTFTYPLTPRVIRLIAHRNALRMSHIALAKLKPSRGFHPPPHPPLKGKINVGYMSSDFNDHPLAHLMQSVFGLHDLNDFNVFVYALTPSDGSSFRHQIEHDSQHFLDVSQMSCDDVVERILRDQIHIRWCDYLVCDPLSCPPGSNMRSRVHAMRSDRGHKPYDVGVPVGDDADPESPSMDWVYTENFIYMPHTYLVTDHRQSCRQDENISEQDRLVVPESKLWLDEAHRRGELRRSLFPDLPLDVVIFANFNQLYKIDPVIFATWLRILAQVPRSILWLLRFPAAGEAHLLRTAQMWAGQEVASRIHFTDVARKEQHIYRCRVVDLFLDTVECSAHTVAADVLWSGTPIIACAWSEHRYKMCSRVAASVANATGFGQHMVVSSREEYEERAISLAKSLCYEVHHDSRGDMELKTGGELINLRRNLFLNRDVMPLFDAKRWTKNLEKSYRAAWRRWVDGSMFRCVDDGNIWVKDEDEILVRFYE
ncbi:glycosyltransferase family 41 protein [Serpula lacrymans var. lacrymans S7.9]|nr:glycosyltransferase family 41 protein [Serpula lacrymans var. lacrymans S7.9]EGO24549.1 glycosyltransferase family 41 protein [Serpula lacrymans var. lacrymans S7.9]